MGRWKVEIGENWVREVTSDIVALTADFGIKPDEPGIIVYIPWSKSGLERLGVLTVSWYINKRRWGFKIVWPPSCKPTIAWICKQVRAHLENFALEKPKRGRGRTWT